LELIGADTLPQAERHINQLHRQTMKKQQRWERSRKTMQKGTVVGIQTVYTGIDVNIVQALRRRLSCTESLITRAMDHGVDPYIAESVSQQLSEITLVRARKPTASIRTIARRTLATYIKGRRMCERMDSSGAQWRHEGVNVRGNLKDFIEGVLPFHSTLRCETTPKAEEDCTKKAIERSTINNGEGCIHGKRRRRLAPC
jgi:hypothetical protein